MTFWHFPQHNPVDQPTQLWIPHIFLCETLLFLPRVLDKPTRYPFSNEITFWALFHFPYSLQFDTTAQHIQIYFGCSLLSCNVSLSKSAYGLIPSPQEFGSPFLLYSNVNDSTELVVSIHSSDEFRVSQWPPRISSTVLHPSRKIFQMIPFL